MKKTWLVLATILFSLSIYVGCKPETSGSKTEILIEKKEYVGSQQCQSCHNNEYNLWKDSHHFHAMEKASSKSILGDFNHTTVVLDNVEYLFFKRENQYLVTIKEAKQTKTYIVANTFGYSPLQQYLIQFPKGKMQTLRATWDSEKKRWFHQRAGENIPPHDWLHWTNQAQNWNSMCASCHSTNLAKNLNENTFNYATHFNEINVACESCHGPGSEHVNLALSKDYTEENSGLFAKAKTAVKQVESCAPCHARRTELVENFSVEHSFYNQFMAQTINATYYEKDGQIKEEDYVYASFASSKMHHNNVQCLDCHDPHSNQLKLKGNALCLQCHESSYSKKKHHFHDINTESAQCVNCHMTGKTYMGNDFRRDHSFRVPRPDQSVKYNTPNACNGCHTKQDAKWASQQIINWYGEERPKHFSDLLLAAQEGKIESLITLVNDTSYPAIARATAIGYLENYPVVAFNTYVLNWTKDSADIVRQELAKLAYNLPEDLKIALASTLLHDDKLAVRIAAFRALLNHYNQLLDKEKRQWKKVEIDYLIFLNHNADFKEGQQNLAQYYYSKGNTEKAMASFKKAIEIDSLFAEPYKNLAVAQNSMGNNEDALFTLSALIKKVPTDHHAHYLRALLYAELNQTNKAFENLLVAIEINPNPTYFYNAVIISRQLGNRETARRLLTEGTNLFPTDVRLQQLEQN